MLTTKIVFNGREYGSVEEMPADVRRIYEEAMRQLAPSMGDADGNGVPDLLEGKGPLKVAARVSTRFVINGRTYGSVEEMPADVRRIYDQAMAAQGGRPAQVTHRAVSFSLRAGTRSSTADAGSIAAGSRSLASDATPIPAGSGLSASGILLRLAAAAALAVAVWWIFRAR